MYFTIDNKIVLHGQDFIFSDLILEIDGSVANILLLHEKETSSRIFRK